MTTLADLMVRIGVDAEDLESGVERAAGFVDRNLGKITAAGVAGGAAIEGMARKMAPMTEQTRRLAAATGISEGAIRDLATETSNVTFPLEDVLDLMESGRQQGIKSAEGLQEYATFWDMVGDATGEVGPELGKAGVALRAVGVAAGDEQKALGALGFITEETTGSVGEFLKFLDRSGPELRGMGVDVDDAAALLGVLEGEMGMTGRTARQEFRQAVNEADGDMGKMLDTLGVSAEQFDDYRSKVDKSSGVIERNADIHADSFTPMQKLTQQVEELTFKYGPLFEAAGLLAVPLLALGPISKIATTGLKGIGKAGRGMRKGLSGVGKIAGKLGQLGATAARTAGQVVGAFARMAARAAMATGRVVAQIAIQIGRWVVLGVQALLHAAKVALAWLISMGPIALVIALVVGLVALIIKNFDKIKEFIRKAWEFIKRNTSKVWRAIIDFFKKLPGRVIGAVSNLFDKMKRFWRRVFRGARDAISDGIGKAIDFFKKLPGRILRALGNVGRLLFDAGKKIVQGLIDGLTSMLGKVGDIAGDIVGKVTDVLPFSPAKEGPLRLHPPEEAGARIGELIAEGLGSKIPMVGRTLEESLPDLGGTVAPEPPAMRAPKGVGRAGRDELVLRLDATGADEDLARVIHKMIRTGKLEEV